MREKEKMNCGSGTIDEPVLLGLYSRVISNTDLTFAYERTETLNYRSSSMN
jgi:hypothetical protein